MKRAFTGASATKLGLLETATGGTVFLDEIGEMPLSMQVKLLHVIQERRILRVGGVKPISLDIRIIAATNKDLKHEVSQGGFREDLFYRLNVVSIRLPRLEERREDIPLLIKHFMDKFSLAFKKQVGKIQPQALRILESYSYPGNIRELENIVERAVALTDSHQIRKQGPAQGRTPVGGGRRGRRGSWHPGGNGARLHSQGAQARRAQQGPGRPDIGRSAHHLVAQAQNPGPGMNHMNRILLVALLLATVLSSGRELLAMNPCADDARKLCPGIVPRGGHNAQCLAAHAQALAPECLELLKRAGFIPGNNPGAPPISQPQASVPDAVPYEYRIAYGTLSKILDDFEARLAAYPDQPESPQ